MDDNGGGTPLAISPRPRSWPSGIGRPSLVARFAPQIEAWLRDQPGLSGAEVLRLAREVGYQGGQSALAELVRRLRPASPPPSPSPSPSVREAFKPSGGRRPVITRYDANLPTLSRAAQDALSYLATRNYSPSTVESYQRAFGQFQAFLQSHRGDPEGPLHQFSGENVQGFMEWMSDQGVKASTVVTRLKALSTIATTMMKLKDRQGRPYLTTNPTRRFEWPTVDQPDTKFLLPEELQRFVSVQRPLRETIARDLLLDTALRVSEVCRLNVEDVLEVDGRLAVAVTRKGRGRRERREHVPLSEAVAQALQTYLAERKPQLHDEPLLLDSGYRRWKRTGLSGLMARIGNEAGVGRFRVSSHKLRHTANVIARMAKIDAFTRSKLLGHSSPESLQRYEHLVPGELHEAREVQQAATRRYLGSGKGKLPQAQQSGLGQRGGGEPTSESAAAECPEEWCW